MTRNRKKTILLLYAFALIGLLVGRATAQTELSGSIANQLSLRLGDPYDMTKLNTFLCMELDSFLEENVSAYADLDLKYAFGNKDISGYIFQYPNAENYFSLNLDEIYLTLSSGIFDVRLGKQKVSWGAVDALAPTDNINPVDYKEFDILDFSNMKIAIPMLKIDAYLFYDYLHIEGICIPRFFPAIYPDSDSDWAFYQPQLPATMEIMGIPLTVIPDYRDTVLPENALGSFEAGLRLGSSVGGFDLSASYFYTWDDNPTIHQQVTPDFVGGTVTITIIPEYHRVHIVGIDAAKALGEFGLRVESAFFITEDPKGEEEEITDPFLKWAVGADYTFFNVCTATLQFSEEIKNLNFSTWKEAETLNSIIGNLSTRLLGETLGVSLSGIYNFEDRDYLIIPQLDYDFSDTLNISSGAQIFGGNNDTLLGHYDQNDAFFVNVTYNF